MRVKNATLSITTLCIIIIMLGGVMLSAAIKSIMLSHVRTNVVILNVSAPDKCQ
jgi:hypothetical protein